MATNSEYDGESDEILEDSEDEAIGVSETVDTVDLIGCPYPTKTTKGNLTLTLIRDIATELITKVTIQGLRLSPKDSDTDLEEVLFGVPEPFSQMKGIQLNQRRCDRKYSRKHVC